MLQTKRRNTVLAFVTCFAATQLVFAAIKTGDTFPDLKSFKLEGKVPDTKGKVVLVDFWASWCGPCKESFPAMNEITKKFADREVLIIAINVDENRSDMESFLKDNHPEFLVLRDAAQKLIEQVDISTMPGSFILDRDGKVRFAHTGFHGEKTKKEYMQELESLLTKKE